MIKFSRLVCLILFGLSLPAGASSPVVYASIKPVAMIVKAVAGDDIEVKALLPESASPHDYALKFSDLRALKQAELFVWVGPELESVLAKALRGIPEENQLVLTEVESLHWPDYVPHHHHHHSEDNGDDHDNDPDNELSRDPHLWLSHQNSLKVAEAIYRQLASKYPHFSDNFADNLRVFSKDMIALEEKIAQQFEPIKHQGFIVVHDAYAHFVDHYGLNQLAVMQLNSGTSRGVRHYSEMVALGDQVACVFTEPQLNPKPAVKMAQTLGANRGELDVMGSDIPLSQSSYIEFIASFAASFTTCLTEK